MQVNFTKKEIFDMKTNEKNVINEISNKKLFIKIYKIGITFGFNNK